MSWSSALSRIGPVYTRKGAAHIGHRMLRRARCAVRRCRLLGMPGLIDRLAESRHSCVAIAQATRRAMVQATRCVCLCARSHILAPCYTHARATDTTTRRMLHACFTHALAHLSRAPDHACASASVSELRITRPKGDNDPRGGTDPLRGDSGPRVPVAPPQPTPAPTPATPT